MCTGRTFDWRDLPMTYPLADIRALLAAGPGAFRQLTSRLSLDALHFRDAPDSWSPFQVVCHVVDGEMSDWIPRVERILSDNPEKPFKPFDREAGFAAYGSWGLPALVDELDRLRSLNLATLARLDLDEATLARTGVHPEFGRVTLGQLVACWAA